MGLKSAVFVLRAFLSFAALDTASPCTASTASTNVVEALKRLGPAELLYSPVRKRSFRSSGAQDARSGCCSHHGGVAGCDSATGYQACNDGSDSPSCGCGE